MTPTLVLLGAAIVLLLSALLLSGWALRDLIEARSLCHECALLRIEVQGDLATAQALTDAIAAERRAWSRSPARPGQAPGPPPPPPEVFVEPQRYRPL